MSYNLPARKIDSLQALRAFAAIAVMAFHGSKMFLAQLKFSFCDDFFVGAYSGVDIFFVISGFIILYTSEKHRFNVFSFLKKRFNRIYPIYWIVTIILIMAYFIAPSADQAFKGKTSVIIGSLTLFPQQRYVIGLAWTLSFEIVFYLVFALSYAAGKKCLFITLGVWSIIILVTYTFNIKSNITAVDTFLNPIIIEFALGCVLAHLYKKYQVLPAWKWIAAAGIGLYLGSWIIYYHAMGKDNTAFNSYISRLYLFGLPATVAVFGLLYLKRVPRLLVYLGNASYSLYLIHGTVISVILKVVFKFRIDGYFANNAGGIVIFILTIAVSCLFYHFAEKPLLNTLNSIRKKARPEQTDYSPGHLAAANTSATR